MQTPSLSRREFLAATAPIILMGGLQLNAAEPSQKKLKILCVGGHPDDPESGCAGTLARYSDEGHSVKIIYLTRGERGIKNSGLDEAAKIRTAECQNASKIMGASPIFFGQIDGATEVNREQIDKMTKVVSAEAPDVMFTHWPIDTHMDHQAASFLAMRAHIALGQRAHLYFFEVNSGSQSQGFFPNTYVDISKVVERKKNALFAHASQDGQGIWRQHHEPIAAWRGREAGVKAAEAFVHLSRDLAVTALPGL